MKGLVRLEKTPSLAYKNITTYVINLIQLNNLQLQCIPRIIRQEH